MSIEENATKLNKILVSIALQFVKYFAAQGVSLSIKEMLLVEFLGQRESASMSELAMVLSQPLTTMTSTITRMVRNGYLERHRIEEDRRLVLVSLSPQGRVFYDQHKLEHIQVATGLLSVLAEPQQESLIAILDQIDSAVLHDSEINHKTGPKPETFKTID
jgi:DNA-binding MarR family transcriptional regulator